MERDTSPQQKQRVTKWLAVFGLAAVLIIVGWASVQVVSYLPNAFSSLASLAEGVNPSQDAIETPITITTDQTVVNAADGFTVFWSGADTTTNTLGFQYDCTEGISLDMRTTNGIEPIPCDVVVPLTTTPATDQVEIAINSEKNRFTDVRYSIGYLTEDDMLSLPSDDIITVVNASIPPFVSEDREEDDVAVTEETDDTIASEADTDTDTVTEDTDTPTPQPTTPQYDIEYTYEIPTSDPNGYVDLEITHLGVGELGPGNAFTPQAELETGDRGAIRFAIRNIGTKTATDWNFTTTLPTGADYTTDDLAALRPNERSTFTLGFPVTDDQSGIESFGVIVDAKEDRNTSNNDFTWSVRIID